VALIQSESPHDRCKQWSIAISIEASVIFCENVKPTGSRKEVGDSATKANSRILSRCAGAAEDIGHNEGSGPRSLQQVFVKL
jgi:hypothetical protein